MTIDPCRRELEIYTGDVLNHGNVTERPRKIRALLDEVGITEVTYHALRRNEAVTFMPRRVKAQAGFTYEQLLALKSFALLRTYGLNARIAAETVEAVFPMIERFVEEGELASEADYKFGVRISASRGKCIVANLGALPPGEIAEVGRLELDLRGVAALLPVPQRR